MPGILKPRCSCGSEKFREVARYIGTTDAVEFYIEDDNTVSCEFGSHGTEICWEACAPCDEPWECDECGRTYTDEQLIILNMQ